MALGALEVKTTSRVKPLMNFLRESVMQTATQKNIREAFSEVPKFRSEARNPYNYDERLAHMNSQKRNLDSCSFAKFSANSFFK
jgi:hypothetical protein